MPTQNVVITKSWTQLVDNTKQFLITLPLYGSVNIEVAITDTNSPPGDNLVGIPLLSFNREGLMRDQVGPGYVWARIEKKSSLQQALVILNIYDADI